MVVMLLRPSDDCKFCKSGCDFWLKKTVVTSPVPRVPRTRSSHSCCWGPGSPTHRRTSRKLWQDVAITIGSQKMSVDLWDAAVNSSLENKKTFDTLTPKRSSSLHSTPFADEIPGQFTRNIAHLQKKGCVCPTNPWAISIVLVLTIALCCCR